MFEVNLWYECCIRKFECHKNLCAIYLANGFLKIILLLLFSYLVFIPFQSFEGFLCYHFFLTRTYTVIREKLDLRP